MQSTSQESKPQVDISSVHDFQRESPERFVYLEGMANKLRLESLLSVESAGSGHATTASSVCEILSVLFFDPFVGIRTSLQEPRNVACDKVILSKGHAAPSYYAAWANLGLFPLDNLKHLREFGNDLEGHPTPRLNFVDVATGSLGQGLGAGCGMAYFNKMNKLPGRIYCICGDGEIAEGSIWEALAFASNYKLNNLLLFVDVNRMGQSVVTLHGHDLESLKAKFQAFGWTTFCVDGHNVSQIVESLEQQQKGVIETPICVLAKTFKGKQFGPSVEDKMGFHGRLIGKENLKIALENLNNKVLKQYPKPRNLPQINLIPKPNESIFNLEDSPFKLDQKASSRDGYGKGLLALGNADLNHERVIVLDADMKNSTFSQEFQQAFPDHFVECYICEQNMISVGLGLCCQGKIPFISTFSSFLSRAFDQLRMSAISMGNLKIYGSHGGCSTGPDGPSNMGLEDIAMFTSIPDFVVLYPSDSTSTFKSVELAANWKGSVYIRGTKAEQKTVYSPDTQFQIGKAKVLRESAEDLMSVITSGVTLNYVLEAADILQNTHNKKIRVIDLFSVKPIDLETLRKAAAIGSLLIVEDHYEHGGLYSAVLSALGGGVKEAQQIAVTSVPRSGQPNDLLQLYGFTTEQITKKVLAMLGEEAK